MSTNNTAIPDSLEEDMTKASITASSEEATTNENENNDVEMEEGKGKPKDDTTNNIDDDDDDDDEEDFTEDDDDDDEGEDPTSSNTTSSKSESDKDPITLLTKALTLKEEGNTQFKTKQYTQASRTYKKAINLIKHLHNGILNSTSNDEQVTSLLLSLQSNLSMVYYKLENYTQSSSIATYVITKIDGENSKAYYRRGLCHYQLKNLTKAKTDLQKAYNLNPKDKAILKEYRTIKSIYEKNVVQKQLKEKEKQKKALSKAFAESENNILYNDKEEELKLKQQKQKEKEEEEMKLKEKRKLEWEEDCVQRLSRNEEVVSFDEYEKEIKKKLDEEEKARKKAKMDQEEEENRKREEERKRRKQQQQQVQQQQQDEEEEDDDDDDILTEKELQSLRGYKKTSDGRTTSYFTREQTEEEKKLLGSIAPKKLDPAAATATTATTTPQAANSTNATITTSHQPQRLDSSVSNVSSSSAWNQAGTWEEKDTSDWCNTSLEHYLKLAKVTTSTSSSTTTSSYQASITKVKDLKGDASVAFVSGKKRYVFDYSTDLSFEIKFCEGEGAGAGALMDVDNEDNNDDDDDKPMKKNTVVAKGSLNLPDISSTSISDEEIEVQIMKWKKEPKDEYREGAFKCRHDLIHQVRQQVFAFVSAFNSQY